MHEQQSGSSASYGPGDIKSPSRLFTQWPVLATEKREADLLQKESIEVMRVLDSQACKRERGGGLGDTGLKGGGKQEFPHTHYCGGRLSRGSSHWWEGSQTLRPHSTLSLRSCDANV